MKLTDAFERVIVLNLPFKHDRKARLLAHLQEADLVDPDKLIWQRATCGDWTGHPAWWSAGNGAWGCLLSHVRACEDAIHDRLQNYLVLEDDAVFHPNAASMLKRVMTRLPNDWGQLYLGGQYLHREPTVVPGTDGEIMRPFNVNRTHAFALNKDTMPLFLRHVLHAPDYMKLATAADGMPKMEGNHFHIDHQLGIAHERVDWPVYSPRWWLAGQDAGDSNVSGRRNPRMWWHWRSWGRRLPFVVLPHDASAEAVAAAERVVHCGYDLVPASLRDRGLDMAVKNPGDLARFLELIAGEAIERWLLPGLALQPDEQAMIRQLWPAGLIPWSAELSPGYPFDSLVDWDS